MALLRKLISRSRVKRSRPLYKVANAKYVYLDIVKFTLDRSVEAQEQIITALNGIVKEAVKGKLPTTSLKSVIYIPIGDGICTVILGLDTDYDSHMRIAIEILRRIWVHNENTSGMQQFEVRIGVNQNDDNIIVDINGNINVTGAGVNDAQRIMSCADPSQILVGRTVYDSLRHRQKYMTKFRRFQATVKHGSPLEVYQYIGREISGLNTDEPSQFVPAVPEESRLSKIAAYYIAHSIKNAGFIIERTRPGEIYVFRPLLWFLARDSLGRSESTIFDPYQNQTPGTPHNTFDEQFRFFYDLPHSVCWELGELLIERDISRYRKCFQDWYCVFPNSHGRDKLKSEWPDIWNKFGFK